MAPSADTQLLNSHDPMHHRKRFNRAFLLPIERAKKKRCLAHEPSPIFSNGKPSVCDPRDWIMRNPSMIRIAGNHPFNAEAPLSQLLDSGFITPTPLHFVRNHGAVPTATWDDWKLEIGGLVKKPVTLTMNELTTKFPSLEFPATIVSSGDRRKEQSMVSPLIPLNWGSGAVSTSVWRGVPLWIVLQRCEVKNGDYYVRFEGGDSYPGEETTYNTSIKLEYAMDPANDIILAYKQNGDLLHPDHGFPLRVIIPGITGGRMLKWLERIIVTSSDNLHEDSNLAGEEVCPENGVNSVIARPSHSEIIPANVVTGEKPYLVRGYAYGGGGRKVTRVEVTLDGGETWRSCDVKYHAKPSRYRKYWFWCFWWIQMEVADLSGAKEIAVRAWDDLGNTQPENLKGNANNCWFRVKINKSDAGLRFEHPNGPAVG